MEMNPSATRMLAWNGLEFEVPADWELSDHQFRGGVGSMVVEDPYAVRLEVEWAPGGNAERLVQVEQRHGAFARKVDAMAVHSEPIREVPEKWVLHRYTLEDGKALVTALLLDARPTLAVFFKLYADAPEARKLIRQARRVAHQFRYVHEGLVPWRVYDFDLRVPHRFRLSSASFFAGRQQLVFEAAFRRFFLWQFSLARRLLRGETPEQFAVRFLNRFKGIPAPRFSPGSGPMLIARRKTFHPLGHYEEIGRWCFRYMAMVIHDLERDRLLIMVYHYRHAADLDWIAELWPSPRDIDRETFRLGLRSAR